MTTEVSTTGWGTQLSDELLRLGRWTMGRYVPDVSAEPETIAAERYLDLEFLRAAIERGSHGPSAIMGQARRDDVEADLRAAVSRFTRQYTGCLSHIAFTGLAHGVGFDMSIERCTMAIRYNMPFAAAIEVRTGEPLTCRERPTDWAVQGSKQVATLAELRALVWRTLYAGNIARLFEVAAQVVRTSARLNWSNAAEGVGIVSDAAEEYLPASEARPFVEDRHALLETEALPDVEGPNPLRDLLRWVPYEDTAIPSGVQTRKVCCLAYNMPDRLGRLCQNCEFLPIELRVAVIRERHGLPQTAPRGPAERESIRLGLEKLGLPPPDPGVPSRT